MRRAWLAAGYAAAFAFACSTTNNVANVTNVGDDAGGSVWDPGVGVGVGETPPDAASDADAGEDASDASVDADASTCAELQGPTLTSCRIGSACSACAGIGFMYDCEGGARPNLPHCTTVDAGICCQAEWMRAPEDDGYCAKPAFPKAFIGPTGTDGQPLLPASTDACDKNGTVGGSTYMMCCPDGKTP